MTTDTLEFPVIDEATAVAVPPPATPDLAKVDLEAVALAQFGDWRADVAQVRNNLGTLVLDLSTQAKVDEAKSLRHRLIGQPRADVRKVSKALKSKLTAVSKAVGAMEEAAVAAYDKAEELITPQIDKRQAELDAEREERLRVERERVAGLQAKLDALQLWADRCQEPGMTADRIKAGMNALSQIELTRDEWQEFYDRAILRRVDVLATMQAEFERKLVAEAEARRLEEQRAEAARTQALLDARQAELDAQAAELKRQAEEIEAERKRMEARKTSLVPAVTLTTPPGEAGDQVDGCRAPESQLDGCSGPVPQDHTSLPASPTAVNEANYAALEEDLGDPPSYEGEPRDQTDAEIEAANGPEVDLPPVLPGYEQGPPDAAMFRFNPDDFRVADAGPPDDDEDEGGIDVLLQDCLNLMEVLRKPYAGRFPSHPKPGPEWWEDVRWRVENLEPRLLMAAAAKKAGL